MATEQQYRGLSVEEAERLRQQEQQRQDFTIQNQYQGTLDSAMAGAQNRQTPLAQAAQAGSATIDQTQGNQSRGQLEALAQALTARSQGRAPSLAELQMNQGLSSAISAQRAQAASARGVSPGMAQRLAAQGIASAQADIAGQGAMLRAAEQAQTEQALGGLLSGMRAQDLGVATSQAGLQQQTNLANAGFTQQANLANQAAEFTNRGQMDSALSTYLGMGMGREVDQAGMYGNLQNMLS
jgi:hypothetical protein